MSTLYRLLLQANALLSVTNLRLTSTVKEVRGRHNGSGSPSAKTFPSKSIKRLMCFGLSSGPDPVLEANASTVPRSLSWWKYFVFVSMLLLFDTVVNRFAVSTSVSHRFTRPSEQLDPGLLQARVVMK
jgi:hypothetical protein